MNQDKEQIVEQIAKKHLRIDTLEERKLDVLDFYEVSVWSLKDALLAAFEAGKQDKD